MNKIIQEKMKLILTMLINIKNLLPYFLLIAIYFFFVNLEASKDKDKNLNQKNENMLTDEKSSLDNQNLRIKIPVIPFDQ